MLTALRLLPCIKITSAVSIVNLGLLGVGPRHSTGALASVKALQSPS
jgi:hypothetical protein